MGTAKDPEPNSKFAEAPNRHDVEEDDLADDVERPAVAGPPTCPRCGWHNTRPSHTRSTLDLLLRTFSLRAYRCRSCGNRFRALRGSTNS